MLDLAWELHGIVADVIKNTHSVPIHEEYCGVRESIYFAKCSYTAATIFA